MLGGGVVTASRGLGFETFRLAVSADRDRSCPPSLYLLLFTLLLLCLLFVVVCVVYLQGTTARGRM